MVTKEKRAALIELVVEEFGSLPEKRKTLICSLQRERFNPICFYVSNLDDTYTFSETPTKLNIEGNFISIILASHGMTPIGASYQETLEMINKENEERRNLKPIFRGRNLTK